MSVREIAQIVDKATATMRALPLAPLHYRALQSLMNSLHPTNHTQKGVKGKFDTVIQLNPLSRADLSWWLSLDRKFVSNPIAPTVPSVTIESDASSKGSGAVLNGQTRTGGVWSAEERNITSITWNCWQNF